MILKGSTTFRHGPTATIHGAAPPRPKPEAPSPHSLLDVVKSRARRRSLRLSRQAMLICFFAVPDVGRFPTVHARWKNVVRNFGTFRSILVCMLSVAHVGRVTSSGSPS